MANKQTRTSRRKSPPSSAKNNQTRTKKAGKGPKKHRKGIITKILLILLSFICVGFLAGVGLFWFYAKDAPKLTDTALDATVSSKLYTQDGELFEDLGAEKREKITANELPKTLEDAIVPSKIDVFINTSGSILCVSSAQHYLILLLVGFKGEVH